MHYLHVVYEHLNFLPMSLFFVFLFGLPLSFFFFFFNDTATTEIYTLSLHDALPIAGVVEAVGNGVTSVKPGDRVYVGGTASGAYAELSLCGEAQVHPLPARVSYAQGAAMNVPYATAYHALFQRGHGDAGETVLVHGASGGVGIGAVQLARARGMTVFGTAGTAEGRRLVLEQGAHHALDHTAPDYLDELLRLTGGKGVNVVLEMLANVNLAKDLDIVAMHGRIVVIGNRGTIAINPRGAMNKNAAIIGVALF